MEEKKVLIKETDLLKVLDKILERWKFVSIVTFCFAIFGIVIALSTAKEYTAEVVVAPETPSSSVGGSNIGSLASLIGVSFSSDGGGDAIYPLLYPDIVSSLPFLASLYNVKVVDLEETIDTTYYAYLKHYSEKTWLDIVMRFPSKAIGAVKKLFVTDSTLLVASEEFNPYMLSKPQMTMIEELKGNISVFVDKKTNVLTLSFTDRDPRVAAIMVDTIMTRLQNEITRYRTKKVVDDCIYIEKMCLEAKECLEISQKQYAEFLNRNRNIINEYVIVEKERYEADKILKTNLYNEWAQQHLLAKAKVQESTPVFVTLKPVTVPVVASSMSRSVKVILFAFLGFVFAILYILVKEPFYSAWRSIKGKNEE